MGITLINEWLVQMGQKKQRNNSKQIKLTLHKLKKTKTMNPYADYTNLSADKGKMKATALKVSGMFFFFFSFFFSL